MNVTVQTIEVSRHLHWPFIRASLTLRMLLDALLRRLTVKQNDDLDRDFAAILMSALDDGAYDVSIAIKDRGWRTVFGLALPREISIGIKARRNTMEGTEILEITDLVRLARDPHAGWHYANSKDPVEARFGRATLRLGHLLLAACRSGSYTLFGPIDHATTSAHELIRAEETASRYDFTIDGQP